jgi:uncharacterized glyoxalase superfamily protein PhnB
MRDDVKALNELARERQKTFEVISEAIKKDKVMVPGFGGFSTKVREERKGRNPATGTEITISPKTVGGSPMSIHLYVKNVDATVTVAVSAGATIIREVQDMFYGDRSGGLQDPSGHQWYVATHIEDVTQSQMKKRSAELFGGKK